VLEPIEMPGQRRCVARPKTSAFTACLRYSRGPGGARDDDDAPGERLEHAERVRLVADRRIEEHVLGRERSWSAR